MIAKWLNHENVLDLRHLLQGYFALLVLWPLSLCASLAAVVYLVKYADRINAKIGHALLLFWLRVFESLTLIGFKIGYMSYECDTSITWDSDLTNVRHAIAGTGFGQPLLLAALNVVGPMVTRYIVSLENWKPAKSHQILLVKLFLLRVVNLSTLIVRFPIPCHPPT